MRGSQDLDIDLLMKAANPVREEEVPIPAESESAQRIYRRIAGTAYEGRVFKRRRRIVLLFVVAFVTLVGGAAAAAVATHHTVSLHLVVSCYAADNLDGEQVAVDATPAGPIASCASAWALGQVGSGPVPLLVGCVTPRGIAAVFPSAVGADVCGQLGLPALPVEHYVPPSGPTTVATTVLRPATLSPELQGAIVGQLRLTCMGAAQAAALITALLHNGHVPWKVRVPTPFPTRRRCASPGFDETDHVIILTGIPPRTSTTG